MTTLKLDRMHVFSDLRPYICTLDDCPEYLTRFDTRKTWAKHEFSTHRFRTNWYCSECDVTLADLPHWQEHLLEEHGLPFGDHPQMETLVAYRKSDPPIEDEECYLCRDFKTTSKRQFITHVAQHLEDISLRVIPGLQLDDEAEISENDSGLDLDEVLDPPQSDRGEENYQYAIDFELEASGLLDAKFAEEEHSRGDDLHASVPSPRHPNDRKDETGDPFVMRGLSAELDQKVEKSSEPFAPPYEEIHSDLNFYTEASAQGDESPGNIKHYSPAVTPSDEGLLETEGLTDCPDPTCDRWGMKGFKHDYELTEHLLPFHKGMIRADSHDAGENVGRSSTQVCRPLPSMSKGGSWPLKSAVQWKCTNCSGGFTMNLKNTPHCVNCQCQYGPTSVFYEQKDREILP